MCQCVCMHASRSQKGEFDLMQVELVIGRHEPLNIDPGHQIQVLWWSVKCSSPLSCLSRSHVSYFSVVVIKHSGPGNLQQKECLWTCGCRGLGSIMVMRSSRKKQALGLEQEGRE